MGLWGIGLILVVILVVFCGDRLSQFWSAFSKEMRTAQWGKDDLFQDIKDFLKKEE